MSLVGSQLTARDSRLKAPSDGGTSSLFGLAPCGVCPARDITAAAVRSYRTFSPLPRRRCPGYVILSEAKDLDVPRESSAFFGGRIKRAFGTLPHKARTTTPRRYIFCGTFRRAIPAVQAWGPSRTLSGTLLCGVRTFLPLCFAVSSKTPRATVRSGCLRNDYIGFWLSAPGFRVEIASAALLLVIPRVG